MRSEDALVFASDGHRELVETTRAAVRDAEGRLVGVLGVGRDITARDATDYRRVVEDLRFHQLLLNEMSAHGPYRGLGVQPEHGLEGTWTDEVARIYDMSPEEYTSREVGLSRIHGPSRQRIEAAIREAVEEGQDWDLELELLSAKGLVRKWVHSRGVPKTKDGEVVQIYGSFQDITERKRVERELRRLRNHLEDLVKERTAQLEAANEELKSFSYSVSHDLRAPLRAISGYSRMLLEDYAPELGEEGQRVCRTISTSARDMGRLIDDLLSFSRVGRTAMQSSPVAMARLAESIFHELTTAEERARIDFEVRAMPDAHGDPTLLRQLWSNLLANAIKFSSKKTRARITVDAERRENTVVYHVRDNGAGFDMKYADKLFGMFQRLHSVREFEGTGVGLAIVQRIAHRHGGSVWADAEVDAGATFYVALPGALEEDTRAATPTGSKEGLIDV